MSLTQNDLLAAAALMAISANGLDSRAFEAFSSAADRRPLQPKTHDSEQAREIAAWNKAVDRAKAEKKLRNTARKA